VDQITNLIWLKTHSQGFRPFQVGPRLWKMSGLIEQAPAPQDAGGDQANFVTGY